MVFDTTATEVMVPQIKRLELFDCETERTRLPEDQVVATGLAVFDGLRGLGEQVMVVVDSAFESGRILLSKCFWDPSLEIRLTITTRSELQKKGDRPLVNLQIVQDRPMMDFAPWTADKGESTSLTQKFAAMLKGYNPWEPLESYASVAGLTCYFFMEVHQVVFFSSGALRSGTTTAGLIAQVSQHALPIDLLHVPDEVAEAAC